MLGAFVGATADLMEAAGQAAKNTALNKSKEGLGLPTVNDPEQAYAQITLGDYRNFVENYKDFEQDMVYEALTDTSLVQRAEADRDMAQQLTTGAAQRNASRLGVNLTPAQQAEQTRQLQLGNTLGGIQGVNDARIAQLEANKSKLSDLMNIGRDINRTSLNQLGSAAADATARKNAYEQAKAAHKQQMYQAGGTVVAGTLLALAGGL